MSYAIQREIWASAQDALIDVPDTDFRHLLKVTLYNEFVWKMKPQEYELKETSYSVSNGGPIDRNNAAMEVTADRHLK